VFPCQSRCFTLTSRLDTSLPISGCSSLNALVLSIFLYRKTLQEFDHRGPVFSLFRKTRGSKNAGNIGCLMDRVGNSALPSLTIAEKILRYRIRTAEPGYL
jgi:hypothetical protein